MNGKRNMGRPQFTCKNTVSKTVDKAKEVCKDRSGHSVLFDFSLEIKCVFKILHNEIIVSDCKYNSCKFESHIGP